MDEFDKRTEELRSLTGKITSTDPLVDFFYLLMRDELPAGKVERLVRDSINPVGKEETVFTNGWLAQYAKNLADLIRGSELKDLLKDLVEEKAISDENLIRLEEEIIRSSKDPHYQEEKSVSSTIEDTKNVVEQLRISGGISEEEAERIEKELEDMRYETENVVSSDVTEDDIKKCE